MSDNTEERIDFLYAAIADAQELIRFTDSKTAIAITIIGSLIVGLFATLENTLKYYSYYSKWFFIVFYLLIILLIACIWITVRIIKPTNNPKTNLNINKSKTFKIKFYIPLNKYNFGFVFFNSNAHKLNEKFEEYVDSANTISNLEMIEVLTLELFKVSFIRNIKNDRFNILISILILTTITFVLEYILYQTQTNAIKNVLGCCCTS